MRQLVEDQLDVLRLAVGRESHDLVLTGVHPEPGVVGKCGIEEAERMREVRLRQELERVSVAAAVAARRPLADAVDRQYRRRLEG